MSDGSAIQWTDATWNPITGCTKVSPGCAHCYIDRTPAFRIAGRRFEHGATDMRIHVDRFDQPLRWRRPRRVFVNSLSDLFHPSVSDQVIDRLFAVMALTPQHTYQILTKRPDRMRAYFAAAGVLARIAEQAQVTYVTRSAGALDHFKIYPLGPSAEFGHRWFVHPFPLPNVWLGVSVENQRFADERIPLLLETPAAVRFISAEPLLGPIDLSFVPWPPSRPRFPDTDDVSDGRDPLRVIAGSGIDWVIVGGESGPGARPFDLGWARSVVLQCRRFRVPVFVKQIGSDPRCAYGRIDGLRDRKGGDPLEWPEDLRVREFPAVIHG